MRSHEIVESRKRHYSSLQERSFKCFRPPGSPLLLEKAYRATHFRKMTTLRAYVIFKLSIHVLRAPKFPARNMFCHIAARVGLPKSGKISRVADALEARFRYLSAYFSCC